MTATTAEAGLARMLERGEIPDAGFRHADHLRVALVYLDEAPTVADAIERMAGTLSRFAARAGVPGRFSRPLTEFWMYQLAAARALMPDAPADVIFAACPRLLDKNLVLAYYSGDAAAPGSPGSPGHAPDRPLPGDAG